jgi:hypothetical protein
MELDHCFGSAEIMLIRPTETGSGSVWCVKPACCVTRRTGRLATYTALLPNSICRIFSLPKEIPMKWLVRQGLQLSAATIRLWSGRSYMISVGFISSLSPEQYWLELKETSGSRTWRWSSELERYDNRLVILELFFTSKLGAIKWCKEYF